MAFTPTTWIDGTTAITATQLNRIEAGVDDAHAGAIDDGAIAPAKLDRAYLPTATGGTVTGTVEVVSDSNLVTGGAFSIRRTASATARIQVFKGESGGRSFLRNIEADAVAGSVILQTDKLIFRPDGVGGGENEVWHAGNTALAVTEAKIGALAVTEAKIGAGAVTNVKIGSGVDAAKLTTGTLPIARIADLAVTNAKLAASGLDAGKLTTGTLPIARIADGAVTSAKLRNSTALSVLGRSANTNGVPADMVAGTDGHVLRRAGTSVGFGTIAAAGITDGAVTNVKIAKPTYGGTVSSSGGGAVPTGWAAPVRNGVGDYTVTHNLGTTDVAVVANAEGAGSEEHRFINVTTPTADTARFYVRTAAGALSDRAFRFAITVI